MVEDKTRLKFLDEITREQVLLWNEKIQTQLSKAVIEQDLAGSCFSRICAVDVAYQDLEDTTISATCAIVTDETGFELASETLVRSSPRFPYIPTHFSLRELPCILEVLPKVDSFGLLLLDCNGRLHIRRFGMACHAGICVGKPTIGVAKSLLCGEVLSSPLEGFFESHRVLAYPVSLQGEIVGAKLPLTQNDEKSKQKAVYVSVGNLISLPTAVLVVSRLIQGESVIPLKLAHERAIQTLQEVE
ncbi:MAG: endonuclease V [Candidatus Hodarchaeota archaeon]